MERAMSGNGKNHIISLPDNPILVSALQEKLIEYHKRLGLLTLNEPTSYEILLNNRSFYKHFILKSVLDSGGRGLNPDELYFEMKDKYGNLNSELFESAIRVIEDYCKTGGKNVTDGKLNMNPNEIIN